MRVSLLLQAIDRMSAPTRRAATGTTRALDGVGRSAERLATRGANAIDRFASRTESRLRALNRRFDLTGKAAYKVGEIIGSSLRFGAFAVGAGATAGLAGVIRSGVEFEKFRTQMELLEGSSAKAKRSMGWITQFAAQTPYQLADVVAAFLQARNYGIDPMNGSLRTLGDTASSMNRDVMSAVEMLADAMTGEFERMKEFGIKGSLKGNDATFSYMTKAGKSAKVTVKKDAMAIQKAILGILDSKFAGGMERQSRTVSGKWSNLMDKLSMTAVKVWDKGVGAAVGRAIDKMLAFFERAEKDGSIDRWATKMGALVDSVVRMFEEADWQQIGRDIGTIASAMGKVAGAIAAVARAANSVPTWLRTGFNIATNPVGQGAQAIGAANSWLSGRGSAPARRGPRAPAAALPQGWRGPMAIPPQHGKLDVNITAPPGFGVRTQSAGPMPMRVNKGFRAPIMSTVG
jgi:hypothetical protein